MDTIGVIWHDETKQLTTEQNINAAIQAHVEKFGRPPDMIFVPPGCSSEAGCPVIERQDILRYDYQAHHVTSTK